MKRCVGVALMLCAMASATHGADGPGSMAPAELLAKGRALYHGTEPITGAIRIGEVALPPAAAACARCHGSRGQGGREAGVEAPAITEQQLTAPGAGRVAYRSLQQVLQAIERGEGRDAARLSAPMPQYALTPPERAALLAYLKVLGTEADQAQGVTQERIVIGSVLPLSGASRADGEQIRAAMASRFEAINRAGGVFGRRLELVVEDGGASAASYTQAAQRLIGQHGVFAVVGSLAPEMPAAVHELILRSGTPFVATLGVALADSSDAKLTYVLPSVQRQLQQLLAELGERCDSRQGVLVLHTPAAGLAQAVKRATEAAIPSVAVDVHTVRSAADIRDVPGIAGVRTVIALMPAPAAHAVREHLAAHNARACFGTLALFSGSGALAQGGATTGLRPASVANEAVGLPMMPVAVSSTGPAGGLWGFLADIAARTFAEALARTGRIVDYQTFDRAMDSLRGYEPVAGLPLHYAPRQRHGLAATHIWKGEAHGN